MGRIPGHCGIHSLKYLGHFSNIRYTLTQPGQKHWKVFLEIQLPLPFKVQRRVEIHIMCIIVNYIIRTKTFILDICRGICISKRKNAKEEITFEYDIVDMDLDVFERISVNVCPTYFIEAENLK